MGKNQAIIKNAGQSALFYWIPAFAGMTVVGGGKINLYPQISQQNRLWVARYAQPMTK